MSASRTATTAKACPRVSAAYRVTTAVSTGSCGDDVDADAAMPDLARPVYSRYDGAGPTVNGISFHRMVVGLLFGSIFLTACLMPAQSDTFWHLRAGADIWRTHHIPFVDTYSYTAAGHSWPNHEWLWQALSYALYRLGGMPLLTGAAALVVMGAFALAYRLTVGAPATRFALMVVGVPLAACVWALRPQIVSLGLLAALITLIARERYRPLPVLFVVWANVHGAVALGVVVVAATAAAAALKARSGDPGDRKRAWTLALLTPVCAAATALTPLGPRLWTFILESMRRSHETLIVEWMPTYPTGPVELGFWVLAIAFVILLARRGRTLVDRGDWSDLAALAAAVVVLPLAIRAVRNVPPFLLLAIPAASRLLGPEFRLRRRPTPADAIDHPRVNLALLSGLVVLGVAAVGVAWASSLPLLGWRPLSAGALAAVGACPGPLYNRYNDGGYLIWFAPETKVFIDSRQDPYPVDFVLDAVSNEARGTYRDMFARHGVRCALLPLASPTLSRLRQDGWHDRFADETWAVLVPPEIRATVIPAR
jgi:hypothetical protein